MEINDKEKINKKENYEKYLNFKDNDDNIYINETIYKYDLDGLRKQDIIKLNYYYNFIKKIPNYKEQEEEMYSKVGINTKLQKINFELKRIYKYVSLKYLTKEEISSIEYLFEYYKFIKSNLSFQSEKSEEYYDEIFELIIKLEISLDMKIGLYEEFINYYEEKFGIMNIEKIKKNIIKKNEE